MRGKAPEEALFTNDPRMSQNQVTERSGVVFAPHDCRRTFSSIAGGLEPGYVVKKPMNHADSGDVTQESYMVLDDARLRAAWQRVASFVMRKVGQKPPRKSAKVLPFTRGAAA